MSGATLSFTRFAWPTQTTEQAENTNKALIIAELKLGRYREVARYNI
jgi:hypothetical protein